MRRPIPCRPRPRADLPHIGKLDGFWVAVVSPFDAPDKEAAAVAHVRKLRALDKQAKEKR